MYLTNEQEKEQKGKTFYFTVTVFENICYWFEIFSFNLTPERF